MRKKKGLKKSLGGCRHVGHQRVFTERRKRAKKQIILETFVQDQEKGARKMEGNEKTMMENGAGEEDALDVFAQEQQTLLGWVLLKEVVEPMLEL